MANVKAETKPKETSQPRDEKKEEMCCEGGMTAAEHRAQSPDGKCCVD